MSAPYVLTKAAAADLREIVRYTLRSSCSAARSNGQRDNPCAQSPRLTVFRTVRTVLPMKVSSKLMSKGAEEARQQLPAILAAAAEGRTTLITRHGRQIAAVVPAAELKSAKPASLLTLAGSGRHLWGTDSSKTIADLRDEWKN